MKQKQAGKYGDKKNPHSYFCTHNYIERLYSTLNLFVYSDQYEFLCPLCKHICDQTEQTM